MASSLEDDYAACLRIARSHYENFPVASWFIPSRWRHHVAAVYAFARTADDFADEEGDRRKRLKLLAAWRKGLKVAMGLNPQGDRHLRSRTGASPLGDSERERILRAVGASVREGAVPAPELFRLLDAFQHDARERGYRDLRELRSYCRNSACSIGRILLHLYGVKSGAALRASDSLCAALQLTNFWQDLSTDLPRGRLCLPRAEARRFRVTLQPRRIKGDENFEALLSYLVGETNRLFDRAANFPGLAPPSLVRQIRMTLAGGRLILSRAAALGPRLLSHRPRLTFRDGPRLLLRALL